MTDYTKQSRTLCFWLRHKPESIGLSVDSQGWMYAYQLIPKYFSEEELIAIAESDKERFELEDDLCGLRIRCRYGHSLAHVKIEAKPPSKIPGILFHGTTLSAAVIIEKEGLKPMGRQHVCLSSDLNKAISNGARWKESKVEGVEVFAILECDKIENLQQHSDHIWTCSYVPPHLLTKL